MLILIIIRTLQHMKDDGIGVDVQFLLALPIPGAGAPFRTEIESLANVSHFHDAVLVTNDRQARQAAEELNVSVHGGFGVLEYATEAARLSGREAVTILEEMIQQGAWISEELAELFKQRVLGPSRCDEHSSR
jgi:hypothetical protein